MDLLLASNTFPYGGDDVDCCDEAHCGPSPSTPERLVLDHPVEGDEAVVQPVELEEDREQHGHRRVDEHRVDGSFQRRGVVEQRDVDGNAESESD